MWFTFQEQNGSCCLISRLCDNDKTKCNITVKFMLTSLKGNRFKQANQSKGKTFQKTLQNFSSYRNLQLKMNAAKGQLKVKRLLKRKRKRKKHRIPTQDLGMVSSTLSSGSDIRSTYHFFTFKWVSALDQSTYKHIYYITLQNVMNSIMEAAMFLSHFGTQAHGD